MGILIRTEQLHKYYTVKGFRVHAVNGVSISIHEGEMVSITGPSGSGKSTLLNLIAGFDKVTSGIIEMGEHHIEFLDEEALAAYRRKNIGFVFQSFNLLNEMSVIENVALPLIFKGYDYVKCIEAAKKVLRIVGIEVDNVRKPLQYSGGQQQRISVARAIISNPKIILADEPTGNLDSKSSEEIFSLLRHIAKGGKTVVVVTHDTNFARMADRTIHLKDGMVDDISINTLKG